MAKQRLDNSERARLAGQASKTHGAYVFEDCEEAALDPQEVASLRELRALVESEPGRKEVRVEIAARPVIIARKVFSDIELQADNPNW